LQQTDGAINTVCRAINSIPKISESCWRGYLLSKIVALISLP
jgi:hypothetical protein